MEAIINIQGLYKIYNVGLEKLYALRDINLKIYNGDFISIIGKSGSGKSTLMNILGCLDLPTMGEYYLNGQCVSKLKDSQLSHIRNRELGFIFQNFNLINSLNAIENVELPLIYRGIPSQERLKKSKDALISVGLEKRLYHTPSQMSGGQQQRVAIARAIVMDPTIILADEPTGNLDSKSSKIIVDILKSLNQKGKTIILITHDQEVAKKAKKIIKIIDGEIQDNQNN